MRRGEGRELKICGGLAAERTRGGLLAGRARRVPRIVAVAPLGYNAGCEEQIRRDFLGVLGVAALEDGALRPSIGLRQGGDLHRRADCLTAGVWRRGRIEGREVRCALLSFWPKGSEFGSRGWRF